MKISIAMATFNGASYLQEQLDSFRRQTKLPDELIISDDNSGDRTLRIVQEFAKRAPFEVLYFANPERVGYCRNFNRALSATSGDLIFLSDQDDVWFTDKIARIVKLASRSEAKVFMNDAALTDGSLNETGLTKLGQVRSAGLPDSAFVMGCCAAIRREFLHLVLPIPPEYTSHDRWLIEIADGIGAKHIHEEVLQYYRRHGLNESAFLANRLRKINRIYFVWQKFKDSLASNTDNVNYHQSRIHEIQLLLNGIIRACERAQSPEREQFAKCAEGFSEKLRLLEERKALLMHSRFRRIPYVAAFWFKGKYRCFSGIQSAFRDIIARPDYPRAQL